jgi:hypothetical protein
MKQALPPVKALVDLTSAGEIDMLPITGGASTRQICAILWDTHTMAARHRTLDGAL